MDLFEWLAVGAVAALFLGCLVAIGSGFTDE